MNNVDLGITIFLALVALNGWRRGIVVSAFSIVGAVLGAITGHSMVANFVSASQPNTIKVAMIGGGLIVGASFGSAVGSFVGRRVRSIYSWTPLRWVDNAGGLFVSALIWIIILWAAARAVVDVPVLRVGKTIRASEIITFLNTNMPSPVVDLVDQVTDSKDLIKKFW